MKIKNISLLILVMSLSLASCHFGAESVKEDVARNQEYKNKRANKEAATALPADAAAKMGGNEVSTTDSSTTAQ